MAQQTKDGEVPMNPNMEVAQLRHLIQHARDNVHEAVAVPSAVLNGEVSKTQLVSRLVQAIVADEMGPYYAVVCGELGIPLDESIASSLAAANTAALSTLDAAIKDAEENAGDSEIRDVMLAKAEYLAKIGDKAAALKSLGEVYEKTISTGQRLDITFHIIRIGFFFNDNDLINRYISKAEFLMEEGGDWDRRNRLKVYRGLHALHKRDFAVAATLFFETVSTFTCTELMSYSTFVQYAVFLAAFAFSRPDLKKKALDGPEVQEVLFEHAAVNNFALSLYECRYADFLRSLVQVEVYMQHERHWHVHTQYFVREMRIKAYSQLLESYRSVTLQSMAASFGISVEFLDAELSRFIASGRINCKIDKVGGIVETNRPDKKNAQYQAVIKQGDLLLNRIQKLSQVIDV